MEEFLRINVDNILYMVNSMAGASSSLGGAKIYYVDENGKLQFLNEGINITGNSLTKLEGLPEGYQDKFVYFAGGMGNWGFVNKDAMYLGRNDVNWTLRFRFHGNEYEVRSYLPIEECPIIGEGEELDMRDYDWKRFWQEYEKQ